MGFCNDIRLRSPYLVFTLESRSFISLNTSSLYSDESVFLQDVWFLTHWIILCEVMTLSTNTVCTFEREATIYLYLHVSCCQKLEFSTFPSEYNGSARHTLVNPYKRRNRNSMIIHSRKVERNNDVLEIYLFHTTKNYSVYLTLKVRHIQ